MNYIPVIGIIAILAISGCTQNCSTCPETGSYSECDDNGMKTRTNYQCSDATDFKCESYTEETKCSTEYVLSGNINTEISPSVDNNINGIIKFE